MDIIKILFHLSMRQQSFICIKNRWYFSFDFCLIKLLYSRVAGGSTHFYDHVTSLQCPQLVVTINACQYMHTWIPLSVLPVFCFQWVLMMACRLFVCYSQYANKLIVTYARVWSHFAVYLLYVLEVWYIHSNICFVSTIFCNLHHVLLNKLARIYWLG